MKKTGILLLFLMIVFGVSACSPDNQSPEPETPGQSGGNETPTDPQTNNMNIVIRIGETAFRATLADNETAKAFNALLPRTFSMSELNGNEKYGSLPQSLPTAASNPGTIRNGDIMLYGASTLVLFYKTFSTSYIYTQIGTLDAPSGLEDVLGNGSVSITFERINE